MFYAPVPTVFHNRNFLALTDRRVDKGQFNFTNLYGGGQYIRRALANHFNSTHQEMAGVVTGEYVVFPNCQIMVNRDGLCSVLNSRQHLWAALNVDEYCSSEYFFKELEEVLRTWDSHPVIEQSAILSDPYSGNYYHWSLEMIPRIRLIDRRRVRRIVVQSASLSHAFQRSLLCYTMDDLEVMPINTPVRVLNPFVVDGMMSQEGMLWLRHKTGLLAKKGKRRIYIRRGDRGTRSSGGGGISEAPELMNMLQENGFEKVQFSADMTVSEQVNMLSGAEIILSAHGAALTNIAYLEKGVCLIEVFGSGAPRAMYMEISQHIGLHYYGYISEDKDDEGNMIINSQQVNSIIESICRGD
jgi:Glycosyltransferase 61